MQTLLKAASRRDDTLPCWCIEIYSYQTNSSIDSLQGLPAKSEAATTRLVQPGASAPTLVNAEFADGNPGEFD